MQRNRTGWMAMAALSLGTIAACDSGTGVAAPDAGGFGAAPAAAPSINGSLPMIGSSDVVLSGENGMLDIDEIRVIVREAELESDDGACPISTVFDDDDDEGDDDSCEFEAPPVFIDLPLDGSPVNVFRSMIPAGRYDELEVEIDDLDDDWSEHPGHRELRAEILAEFPEWPKDASAMVVGTFTPTGGDPIPFRVFLEAEVEVEMDLSPALVVDDGGNVAGSLTVELRPDLWFTDFQGRVLELSDWDWDATGSILELEVEFENGFAKVEIDD